jgi:subtilisin family serine protease
MTVHALATPWAPGARLYSLPGSMILKLALGEASAAVPTRLDVRERVYEPATRLDDGPIDRLLAQHAGAVNITRVFGSAAGLGKAGQRHLRFDDIEHVTGVARTFRVDMPPATPVAHLINDIRQLSVVEAVGHNYACAVPFAAADAAPDHAVGTALDDDTAWAPRDQLFAAEALAYEPGDSAVVLGIIDSGVAPDHPELAGRFRSGFDTVHLSREGLAAGMRLLGDKPSIDHRPIDHFVGHGMGCAGIIGAIGERIPPGLAGNCQILPIRVLGAAQVPGRPAPIGIGSIADIDAGMKLAVDLGAKVLNMSFGTADTALDPAAPKPHADVVRYACLRSCVLVAASGNSGLHEAYWPAAFDGVIAVGSIGLTGRPSPFTTTGDHVALCAPGERVATAALDGYQLATGTSFAAPFAAAAAALLVSRAEGRSFPVAGPVVRQILTASASPFATTTTGCGAGILNAFAALQHLDRYIDAAPAGGADMHESDLVV